MWQEWAARAQQGDKAAYNQLLRDILPYIRNYIAPRVSNPDWIDDITQEVLISVHRSLNTYSPDRPFKPWLSAIISFRKTDFLRRHYKDRENRLVGTDSMDFVKQHVTYPAHLGELKDVESALEQLPEKQRRLFTLIKIEGYSTQEVAQKMNMSVSAVKVAVHRTTNKLKKILE